MLMPFMVAMLVSAALQPLLIWLLTRTRVLDHPNARSSHSIPTPRGGGVGVVLGAGAALAVAQPEAVSVWQVFLISVGMAVLGLLDDLLTLPPLVRLLGQFGLAGLAGVVLQAPELPVLISVALAVVWLSGFVNAFNFMDGINGISALSAALAGFYFGILGVQQDSEAVMLLGAVTAGAALGFYPANAIAHRIFLGDVGSYFLGGIIGLTAWLASIQGTPVMLVLAPLLLYLVDTTSVLIRRLVSGEPLLEAHRDHAYQRLTDLGHSHSAVAWAVTAVSALVTVTLFVAYAIGLPGAGIAAAAAILLAYVASPRLLAPTT